MIYNGKEVLPPQEKKRQPKYEGQRLTERYTRTYYLAAQEGDTRIVEDGTRYVRNPKTGTWRKENGTGTN